MFLGHFAVALAAKKVAPRLNLGLAMLAAQGLDVVWPVLVLSGVERVVVDPTVSAANPLAFEHYPYSHSLLAAAFYALLAAGVALGLKAGRRTALVLGGLVLSHWGLDWLMHVPDLPLSLGESSKHGLGLWHSIPASVAIEFGLLAWGAWLYWGVTQAKDAIGRWALPMLLGLLALIQLGSYFGPPPPSAQMVAGSALGMWLFFAWGAWADRHRRSN